MVFKGFSIAFISFNVITITLITTYIVSTSYDQIIVSDVKSNAGRKKAFYSAPNLQGVDYHYRYGVH